MEPQGVASWAGAEVSKRIGHQGGLFPFHRIHEVIPVRIVADPELGPCLRNGPSGAMIALPAQPDSPEERWHAACWIGAAVLYCGWLTGARLLEPADHEDCAQQCRAFARALLGPRSPTLRWFLSSHENLTFSVFGS